MLGNRQQHQPQINKREKRERMEEGRKEEKGVGREGGRNGKQLLLREDSIVSFNGGHGNGSIMCLLTLSFA